MSPERNFGKEVKSAAFTRRFLGFAAIAAALNTVESGILNQRALIDEVDESIKTGIAIGEDYRYQLFEDHGITGEEVDAATWSPHN